MTADRLELIEKAFSLRWCKENLVLPESNIIKAEGNNSIIVYVSDLNHLTVLGDFITKRLKSECELVARFEEAKAEDIKKVLNHLELSKKREEEKLVVVADTEEVKSDSASHLVENKDPDSIKNNSNTDDPLPDNAVFYMEGRKSNLTVYSDELKLVPVGVFGFMTQGLSGEKSIPFDSIQAVQFKEGGAFTVGFLQFTIMGGSEASGGVFKTGDDENTFTFGDKHHFGDSLEEKRSLNNELVVKIRDYIKTRIREMKNGSIQVQADSVPEQLIKLKSLLDQGVLTEDEFIAQKKKLLG